MGCGTSNLSSVQKQLIKECDVKENEYKKAQEILIAVMDFGIDKISTDTCKYALTIGKKGSGKSTVSNVLYGTDFITGKSCDDVTTSMQVCTSSSIKNLKIIDSIGLVPSVENFAKIVVMLFSNGYFPDFCISCDERLGEYETLIELLNIPVLDILVVPFSAKSYHTLKKLKHSKSEILENAFDEEILEDLENFNKNKMESKLKIYKHSIENKILENSSMKENLLKYFFKKDKVGKYKLINYSFEEVLKCRENKHNLLTNQYCTLFYGCLIKAITLIPASSIQSETKLIGKVNELEYFKKEMDSFL